MRARNIKPGFFINAELSEVDFATRLLFVGLWCYADREGRFEWKPKQIKATIFPYDRVDVEKLLGNLMSLHLITCHAGVGYVENFKKHQNPHPHEAKSNLPEKPQQNQCHDMSLHVTKCNADSLIPDSLIPDIRIPDSKTLGGESKRFTPPSLEDVKVYCLERKNRIDPQGFIDHYQARGWKPKGYTQQMKDWKAAVRTWERGNRSAVSEVFGD